MVTKEELIDAYATWLGEFDWDWFATLTFRGYPSPTVATRKFEQWISQLEQEQGTQTFRYVKVMESGSYRSNNHFHVLVGGLKPKARRLPFTWKWRWEEMAGQAAIQRFEQERGGIRYLLKTLLPDRDCSITLQFREPRAERVQPPSSERNK